MKLRKPIRKALDWIFQPYNKWGKAKLWVEKRTTCASGWRKESGELAGFRIVRHEY